MRKHNCRPLERHAAERIEQRYGVPLTEDLRKRIVREIGRTVRSHRKQKYHDLTGLCAVLTGQWAGGRERWVVRVDDIEFHVVYAVHTRTIITFLPAVGSEEWKRGKRRVEEEK